MHEVERILEKWKSGFVKMIWFVTISTLAFFSITDLYFEINGALERTLQNISITSLCFEIN